MDKSQHHNKDSAQQMKSNAKQIDKDQLQINN